MSNAQTLPMRFRILEIMADNKVYTTASMMEALKAEYQGEGQLSEKNVNLHFDASRAVGLIDCVDAELNSKNELVMQYKISEFGHERCNTYLPKR